ncbi:MAG TPA: OsmC family protein [Candidatus Acidoferrales bacterium]|nr:OsmC family protein [Candidatus Acidoferrales bacterium]
MTELPLFFQVEVEWKEKRAGKLRADSLPTVDVAAPPEFGRQEQTWTPEHLFVAAVNSCFMTIFLAIAENSRLTIVKFRSRAKGKLEKVEPSGYQITEVVIKPELVIQNARDLDRAALILRKAEKNCLIANSIKSAVKIEPAIYHQQVPAQPCPAVQA